MKRIAIAGLLAITLALGACASQPEMRTRYTLDQANNLVKEQYTVPGKSACDTGSINWCVAAAITVGVVAGVWGLDRIINKDDDSPAPAQGPALIPSSGSSTSTTTNEFENTFITPGFVTVN